MDPDYFFTFILCARRNNDSGKSEVVMEKIRCAREYPIDKDEVPENAPYTIYDHQPIVYVETLMNESSCPLFLSFLFHFIIYIYSCYNFISLYPIEIRCTDCYSDLDKN